MMDDDLLLRIGATLSIYTFFLFVSLMVVTILHIPVAKRIIFGVKCMEEAVSHSWFIVSLSSKSHFTAHDSLKEWVGVWMGVLILRFRLLLPSWFRYCSSMTCQSVISFKLMDTWRGDFFWYLVKKIVDYLAISSTQMKWVCILSGLNFQPLTHLVSKYA